MRLQIDFEQVLGKHHQAPLHWPQAQFVLLREDSAPFQAQGLQLSVTFLPEEIENLIDDFLPLGAYRNGFFSYAFEMKPEVLLRYQAELSAIGQPHEILKIDKLACLELANYNCIGPASFHS